jgi:hypothetical protein
MESDGVGPALFQEHMTIDCRSLKTETGQDEQVPTLQYSRDAFQSWCRRSRKFVGGIEIDA